jgi:hypothetical protein
MLNRITNQRDEDIKNLSNTMQAIMEVMNIIAEYNSGLLIFQIGEPLDEFNDRVTVLVNAVQQLNHRRLAIYLLTPGQIATSNSSTKSLE